MALEPLYEPAGPAVTCTPLLPLDTFQALDVPLESSVTVERDLAAQRRCLQRLLDNPIVHEAILVSDVDLFEAIPRWRQAPDGQENQETQARLLYHLIRLSTRPSPWDLFAGVAAGRIGSQMDVRLGPVEQSAKRTRPNLPWVMHLVGELEKRPQVAAHLRYFASAATFVRDDRLYAPDVDPYSEAVGRGTVSLRATPPVRRALALAREGIPLDELAARLRAEFPDAGPEKVGGLLDTLRRHGLLLSELRPPVTSERPAHHLLAGVENLPDCDDLRRQLETVLRLAGEYDARPIGQGVAAFQALLNATQAVAPHLSPALQVDLHVAFETNTVSAIVAEELAQAAEIFLRLSTYKENPYLARYRQLFRQRYGEQEAPVLELLDEDVGLGPPPSYVHPPRRTGGSEPLRRWENPARDRLLLQLAAATIREKRQEIDLDEALLEQLQTDPDWRRAAPFSLEPCASVAAPSLAALDAGNFEIIVAPYDGADPAGRALARFYSLLGPEMAQAIRRAAREEEACWPEQLLAEIAYLPSDEHSNRIGVRAAVRRYEIAIGASPGVDRANVIPADDLLVGLRGDRFYLRSASRGVQVWACSTNLVNTYLSPNLCRFLDEVSDERNDHAFPFDWGAARDLPFLPRVRVGRTILRPAEWRLPLETARSGAAMADLAGWCQTIAAWREQWDVPRYVYLAEDYRSPEADDRLLLDLQSPLCLAYLRGECQRRTPWRGAFTLQEMLPAFDCVWTEGPGGRYLVEFIVPLKRH
jgi:hypothetical protein